MFVENKYLRWYRSITAIPDTDSYTERHHIIPRSLGGGEGDNLVRLNPRKHFLAHWLLTKCTSGHYRHKMLNALNMMRRAPAGRPPMPKTSWRYAVARRAMQEMMSTREVSEETRRRIGDAHRGKTIGEEHRAAVSKANLGRKHTAETRAKVSAAGFGRTYPNRKKPDEECRLKVVASLIGNQRKLGFKDPEETIARKKIAHRSSRKAPSNNKLGVRGVSLYMGRKFRARTRVDGKTISIGIYDTAELAHLAYLSFQDRHLANNLKG